MKKFVFSLEKVLTLKQQMLDVAINELSIIQASLYDVITEIERLNALFDEYGAKVREEFQTGITPLKIMAYKGYLSSINEQIKQWIMRKNKLEEEIQSKREEVVTIKSDVSIIEKLKDKKLREYRLSMQKLEEITIEEYVSQTCMTV